MLQKFLSLWSPLDWFALLLFLGGWMGYSYIADRAARSASGLRGVTHLRRVEWARQMTDRENRITDASLIGDLKASVSFYANATIYILAGLIAVAGTLERVVSFTEELPFARQTSRELLEAKMFVLIGIFIFAYFKFTWSLRQFNFLSILLGATPPKGSASDGLERAAERFALMSSLAGDEFNRGIRAYYFGFAILGWFVHPGLFIVLTLTILAVLWRRDFYSHTLRAMSD
jgi:uncharacterized membrane protein